MTRLERHLRFWMLLPVLVVAGDVELAWASSIPPAAVLYGAFIGFLALVMIAVIDGEGRPTGERNDVTHGRGTTGITADATLRLLRGGGDGVTSATTAPRSTT